MLDNVRNYTPLSRLLLLLILLDLVACGKEFLPIDDSSQGSESQSTNGNISFPLISGTVRSIKRQEDSKLLIGGDFTEPGGLLRLNADGTLDEAFAQAQGSGFNGPVLTILISSEDKIIVGGDFTDFNGSQAPHLARLESSGALDSTFTSRLEDGFNAQVTSLSQDSTGVLWIGGDFTEFRGIAAKRLLKLTLDGELSPEFGLASEESNGTTPLPEATASATPSPEPSPSPSPSPEPSPEPSPTPSEDAKKGKGKGLTK